MSNVNADAQTRPAAARPTLIGRRLLLRYPHTTHGAIPASAATASCCSVFVMHQGACAVKHHLPVRRSLAAWLRQTPRQTVPYLYQT